MQMAVPKRRSTFLSDYWSQYYSKVLKAPDEQRKAEAVRGCHAQPILPAAGDPIASLEPQLSRAFGPAPLPYRFIAA